MKVKKSYIVGGVLMVLAAAFAMNAFQSTLTPYVTVSEAKASGRPVQVAGIAVKGTDRYDLKTNNFVFKLREDGGAEMIVEYAGARPGSFDDATKVVAVGRYEHQKDTFRADELLVKCPTKYEERVKGE